MNINQLLIKELIEINKVRHLAVFISFKCIYGSGCVHNYSPSKFSHVTKLSRNSVKKYIDYFLENGWCRMEGNNLIFNKFKSIDGNKLNLKVKINAKKTIKEIELLLYRELLRLKESQFNFNKQLLRDLKNPTGLAQLKKARAYCRKKGVNSEKLPSAPGMFKLSMIKIAKMFNCSVGKASGIIDELCLKKMIQKFRQMEILCFGQNKVGNMVMLSEVKGSYFSRNKVVLRYTNRYKF